MCLTNKLNINDVKIFNLSIYNNDPMVLNVSNETNVTNANSARVLVTNAKKCASVQFYVTNANDRACFPMNNANNSARVSVTNANDHARVQIYNDIQDDIEFPFLIDDSDDEDNELLVRIPGDQTNNPNIVPDQELIDSILGLDTDENKNISSNDDENIADINYNVPESTNMPQLLRRDSCNFKTMIKMYYLLDHVKIKLQFNENIVSNKADALLYGKNHVTFNQKSYIRKLMDIYPNLRKKLNHLKRIKNIVDDDDIEEYYLSLIHI